MGLEFFIALTFILAGILFFVILAFIHNQGKRKEAENRVSSLYKELTDEKDKSREIQNGYDNQITSLKNEISEQKKTNIALAEQVKHYVQFYNEAKSNLTLFPYMAGIVSEFETRDIEVLARKLEWGHNAEREKKGRVHPLDSQGSAGKNQPSKNSGVSTGISSSAISFPKGFNRI